MTPYEFGFVMGKRAADMGLSGTYSGGIRTQDAQGNATKLNPAQQQRVDQIAKIRAMNRGEAPVGPLKPTAAGAGTPAAPVTPSPANPAVTRTKSRSAF